MAVWQVVLGIVAVGLVVLLIVLRRRNKTIEPPKPKGSPIPRTQRVKKEVPRPGGAKGGGRMPPRN